MMSGNRTIRGSARPRLSVLTFTSSRMSGGKRAIEVGAIYHVISRFVAREFFVESAAERNTYLSLLGFWLSRSDWRCFSFAVMSNHIHLGLVAGEDSLASWLRHLNSNFANWINVRKERIGAVFVKGPNVVGVQRRGAARLISYIHNNPVRAGVVDEPIDSDWTSHRAYLGKTRAPSWLDVDGGLARAGFDSPHQLATWMTATRIERRDLEAFTTARAKRGRPRRVAGEALSD